MSSFFRLYELGKDKITKYHRTPSTGISVGGMLAKVCGRFWAIPNSVHTSNSRILDLETRSSEIQGHP